MCESEYLEVDTRDLHSAPLNLIAYEKFLVQENL